MKSYWIDTKYACYWIEIENDRVVKAPPIADWMLGKRYETIRRWIVSRSFTMTELTDA